METVIKHIVIFSASLLCIAHLAIAQNQSPSPPDTALAHQYFTKGEQFTKEAQHDSANIYLQKAAEIYRAHRMWNRYVRCCNKLGELAQSKDLFEQAGEWLRRALAVVERQKDIDPDAQAVTYQLSQHR